MAAARNRPRAPLKEEGVNHEESELWYKIRAEILSSKEVHEQALVLENEIEGYKAKISAREATLPELERLQTLYSDYKVLVEKEAEQTQKAIEMTDLLTALRAATEGGDRGADSKRNDRKRKLNPDVAAAAAAAAAASASGGTGFSSAGTAGAVAADSPSNRKLARSNSAAPTEGLQIGAEVAYRLPKKQNAEGEWIQCHVINILGDGNKRKYEVQDPEPDDAGEHSRYRAGASALIPIPRSADGLPPYPAGKQVLARYPETTTFYRAEVMGTKRDGTCRLKFEGEEEVGKETEVERRLVLDVGNK